MQLDDGQATMDPQKAATALAVDWEEHFRPQGVEDLDALEDWPHR